MKKINHIGIAVNDIEKAKSVFSRIFGIKSFGSEIVETESVITSFFQLGESKIELVSPISNESVISKYLAKNKEGAHHIAFDVENIYEEIDRLQKEGIRVLNETPKKGANNKLIAFLHPKDTCGVLIEICQNIN